MLSYTTVEGRAVMYPAPSPEVAAFLARLELAINDAAVTSRDFHNLAYSAENPIMDLDHVPGVAFVTRRVFENPVYRIVGDLIARKQIATGELNLEKAFAAHTLDVPSAAKQLGVTGQAIRSAIDSDRLSAVYRSGQWWLRPETVAAFKLSRAGRPKKVETVAPLPVAVVMGNESGKSLSVRVEGVPELPGERIGSHTTATLPEGWTRAAVKATGQGGAVYVIEPAAELGEIVHGGLSVRGGFRVVEKIADVKQAQAAWKAFGMQKRVGQKI